MRIPTLLATIAIGVTSLSASAGTITATDAVLQTLGTIGLGQNVQVTGNLAANQAVNVNNNSTVMGNIYAGTTAWVGDNVTLGGNVLANQSANAGSNLTMQGNWSGASVSMGANANVTGNIGARSGQISLGNKANITGNVAGNGSIWVGDNGRISGNANPGKGQSLSKGRNVSIGGSIAPTAADVDVFAGLSTQDFIPPAHGSAGTNSVWVNTNSQATLDDGSYGSVSTGSKATVNFTSGVYTLAQLVLGNNNVINIDTSAGDVILNILSGLSTGQNTTFATTGGGNLIVNVFDGDAYLGNSNVFTGVINVYNGSFQTGQDNQLTGLFSATNSIWIGNNSVVVAGEVPEPATAALLALGVFALATRRRRRAPQP